MDQVRLRKLAGMETSVAEALAANEKELEITEEIHMGANLTVDSDEGLEKLKKRMDGVRRALDLIPRLRDGQMRMKHLARVRDNAQLIARAIDSHINQGSEAA